MQHRRAIHLLLHLSAGVILALASLLADYVRGLSFHLGTVESAILVSGLLIIFLGFVVQTGAVARASEKLCLIVVSIFIALSFLEGVFRVMAFDFAREEAASRKLAPFYREPTVPTGEAFFRRFGPEQWTGQVLNTLLKQYHISPNPYENEPSITVTYNHLGFRNEAGFADWEVVVVGDSFTELGHLKYDQIFTTILGKILNIRVLNLGASVTGPLTHLSYLRDYGFAPSTRHVIVVFFEGNDLVDLRQEYTVLMRYRETGRREYREFKTQTSLLRALLNRPQSPRRKTPADKVTAHFKNTNGDIPISLDYLPPEKAKLPAETMDQLEYFFRRYAELVQEKQIKAWLVYMPCKLRVVYGHIEFTKDAPEDQKQWKPSDFPQIMSALSRRYGIDFIDMTPVLVEETKRSGELLYSPMYDTHLNSRGSLVVAKELARNLSAFFRFE